MSVSPAEQFSEAMRRARSRGPVSRLGVAVSGGGDSMALLRLATDWARGEGVQVFAATVDHGLREDAAQEAAFVAQTCATLAIPHETLVWNSPDQPGNLQDSARRARYGLLRDWAQRLGIEAIALGHTADDQAETFVMRLARGSGVDGLAAMRSDWQAQGQRWLRPLITSARADLRDVLRAAGQGWVEDPSNRDTRFERVRVRQAMDSLAELGLDRARLIDTATRMADARLVLAQVAQEAARHIARVEAGEVCFQADAYQALAAETRHRLLAQAIQFVSSSPYRPRYAALRALEDEVMAGQRRTLQGCVVAQQANILRVGRELNALADTRAAPGALWDGRWTLTHQTPPDGTAIRALGEGIAQIDTWRETGFARDTLMTTPAVWQADRLIAAPVAGMPNGWAISHQPMTAHFVTSVLSH